MDRDKIALEPAEILISRDTKEGSITLRNTSGMDCGFKVKTTHPASYNVRPCLGVIERGKAVAVSISLQRTDEHLSLHKFQLQFVAGTKVLLEENLARLFTLPGMELIEKRVGVRYADEEKMALEGFRMDNEGDLPFFVCVVIVLYYLLILLRKLVFGV